MANICLVDDDFGIEALAERLEMDGHHVSRFTAADAFLDGLPDVSHYDLFIIDLLMAPPSRLSASSTHGGHRTGLSLLKELRRLAPSSPAIIFTAKPLADLPRLSDSNASYFCKTSFDRIDDFSNKVVDILGESPPALQAPPFIVHGHDDHAKYALKNFLQNDLQFPEPVILHEQPSLGRTIMEKFEHLATASQLVFVLLTPDDKMADEAAADDVKRRARQNVIFEMGYFLGTLGRLSGRVILLYKGTLELPGDISGLVYIDISAGIEAAGEQIRRELRDAI